MQTGDTSRSRTLSQKWAETALTVFVLTVMLAPWWAGVAEAATKLKVLAIPAWTASTGFAFLHFLCRFVRAQKWVWPDTLK